MIRIAVLLIISLSFSGFTLAAEPLVFRDAAEEARFQQLTEELRCLVCQNQNLADSDAPLAQDLRREIHKMLQSGRSNAEIKTFLVDRYGDFVLYRPPVKTNTLALWAMPLLLLFGGFVTVLIAVRRRGQLPNETPPDDYGPEEGGPNASDMESKK